MDNTNEDTLTDLFPMPMTSIEKFFWFDDRPDYPHLIFCHLRVPGKIDETFARQAWQVAIQRQPFGDVDPVKVNGRWQWVLGPRGDGGQNSSFATWNGTGFEYQTFPTKPPAWSATEHPIRGKTGSNVDIRVWHELSNSNPAESDQFQSEVWISVHHAITDGVGAMLVVNEWMVAYANLAGGRPAESGLPRLDARLLKRRNHLGLLNWRYLKHLWKQPVALFGAAKFVFRKTDELIPKKQTSRTSETPDKTVHFPSVIGSWISESQTSRMADVAESNIVMLNSVLLGQLYLALADWRTSQNCHSENDWIRIILPMNIRDVADRRLPAANRSTLVQVDRRSRDAEDLKKFYQLLDREISIIRGWQLDKIFLLAIGLLSIFDSWIKRAARNEKSRGMAVFTNLGEPFRKNERARLRNPESDSYIRLSDFNCVGPIRLGTPVNFSVSRHNEALRISLHYDSRVLSAEQADSLLRTYVDRVNNVQ